MQVGKAPPSIASGRARSGGSEGRSTANGKCWSTPPFSSTDYCQTASLLHSSDALNGIVVRRDVQARIGGERRCTPSTSSSTCVAAANRR